MEKLMKATVFGATGYIGSHTAEQLRMQGYEVMTPVRKECNTSFLQSLGCQICEVNFDQDESIKAAINEKSIVYNCIAALNTDIVEESIRSIEVDLTRRIIRLAKEKGATGYIQLSSIISYGHQLPDFAIDEDFPQTPEFILDVISLERETAVNTTCQELDLPYIILQPVSTIGKRARGNSFSQLVDMYQEGKFPLVSGGKAGVSLIDTRDVGRCMAWLGEYIQTLAGQTLLLKGFDTTWLTFKQTLDKENGKVNKAKKYPFWLLDMLGAIGERTGNPLMSRRVAGLLGKNKLYQDTRIRRAGFAPIYSLEDAVTQVMCESGKVS